MEKPLSNRQMGANIYEDDDEEGMGEVNTNSERDAIEVCQFRKRKRKMAVTVRLLMPARWGIRVSMPCMKNSTQERSTEHGFELHPHGRNRAAGQAAT